MQTGEAGLLARSPLGASAPKVHPQRGPGPLFASQGRSGTHVTTSPPALHVRGGTAGSHQLPPPLAPRRHPKPCTTRGRRRRARAADARFLRTRAAEEHSLTQSPGTWRQPRRPHVPHLPGQGKGGQSLQNRRRGDPPLVPNTCQEARRQEGGSPPPGSPPPPPRAAGEAPPQGRPELRFYTRVCLLGQRCAGHLPRNSNQ
ncbi:hypothetical protein HJG60_011756 [Phyllostomus discolor]|uniref:Uncharacterized protein n=1 Tax=Phyllostomus discolor TaxID=89673 RepID=A0A833ZNJ9_9CHIR|nr:hypothetical protein HJG60_011756 [Phyllostomus discolor]